MILTANFKQHFLLCAISCEPVVGFLPHLHEYIVGTLQRAVFGDLDLIFKVTVALKPTILSKIMLVCMIFLIIEWNFTKFARLYYCNRAKNFSNFGDFDLFFKLTALAFA